MTHARLRALQSELLDGRISPRQRARLERHLAECDPCRRELRELERTVRLLRELPPPELPPELTEQVMADVASRTLHGSGPASAGGFRFLAPLAAAAAAVVLLTVVQGVEVSLVLPGFGDSGPQASGEASTTDASAAAILAERRPLASFQATSQPEVPAAPREAPRERVLENPLPPMASCLVPSPTVPRDCARWHAWLVGLAARDPSAFVAEVESLPAGVRERWLGELSEFAAHAGAASLLAAELRASGDPRASSLARRFERTTAVVSRR